MTLPRRSKRGVFYYALGAWRSSSRAGEGVFTQHEKSTYPSVIIGIGLLTVAEMVPVHVLLSRWTPIAAWIATALALYTLLWFIADWRATCVHPVRLDTQGFEMRAGLRWDVSVPLDAIASIGRPERGGGGDGGGGGNGGGNGNGGDGSGGRPLKLSLFGDPDLVMHTRQPVEVLGLYGVRRQASAFAFAVDEPQRLLAAWDALRGAP